MPLLQWNYEDQPDFNEDGFHIDYELIHLAHPPLRDRMLYGLHKVSTAILDGISVNTNYPIRCNNFEPILQQIYDMTTEDVIDINQLDYEWLLKDAKEDLRQFVSEFNLNSVGLSDEILSSMCPESDSKLRNCMDNQVNEAVQEFYHICVEKIDEIFPAGRVDLLSYLGK